MLPPQLNLIADPGHRAGVGLSFAGGFGEAISLIDHNAVGTERSRLRKRSPIPESFDLHLFVLRI
jgi:hypothetical protein